MYTQETDLIRKFVYSLIIFELWGQSSWFRITRLGHNCDHLLTLGQVVKLYLVIGILAYIVINWVIEEHCTAPLIGEPNSYKASIRNKSKSFLISCHLKMIKFLQQNSPNLSGQRLKEINFKPQCPQNIKVLRHKVILNL